MEKRKKAEPHWRIMRSSKRTKNLPKNSLIHIYNTHFYHGKSHGTGISSKAFSGSHRKFKLRGRVVNLTSSTRVTLWSTLNIKIKTTSHTRVCLEMSRVLYIYKCACINEQWGYCFFVCVYPRMLPLEFLFISLSLRFLFFFRLSSSSSLRGEKKFGRERERESLLFGTTVFLVKYISRRAYRRR